jgi:hypothetical protein
MEFSLVLVFFNFSYLQGQWVPINKVMVHEAYIIEYMKGICAVFFKCFSTENYFCFDRN